jgi:hypothetical protein
MDDPATGAPSAAPSPTAGPSAASPADAPDAPFASEQEFHDAIASLTKEEADAVMAEFTANFNRPPPAPLVPSNAREADARLAQLITDADWVGKLLNGDLAVADEFHRLNGMKAGLSVFDPAAETGGISVGPGLDGPKLSRRDAIDAASDLRQQGASDEEIKLILSDEPYPADIVRDARYWLPRMQADPLLRVPLSGYSDVDRERLMGFFRRAIAIGDGSGPFG